MAIGDNTADWANEEFAQANPGDARLSQRLVALARQLATSPHTSLPQALSPAELKAAYRFFANDLIDPDGVLAPHIAQTLRRMEQIPVVLAIQDTTEFNLTHLHATECLGPCTGGNERGFLMHSLLAVSPEGLPLDVLGMKTWTRPEAVTGSAAQCKSRPIHEKESVKWFVGPAHLSALKVRCAHTQLIGIGDRESDVYELFATQRPEGAHWLVRAAWNRRAHHPQRNLWQAVLGTPVAGHIDLPVPAKGTRAQRTARLTLRYAPVRLQPPKARAGQLPGLNVFAIHAIEDEPPVGIEPIEWMLLSSVPTHSPEQALERLQWYARRRTIETWHRVLKSGCRIEARQFGTLERFVRATALFAVIAWRILYTTLLARLDGELPCDVVLQPADWQALYCRVHRTTRPPDMPSLQQAVLWIATLDGYFNRHNDPPPGTTVIWRGFLVLHEITEMFRIFNSGP
ncbi:IS4 family transposase [Paraburkholderia humisilvae]|uniref:IS4 family transposase n=1 Tax=Paraburkholderia humisilvae TaxID=627669 RepID=UPI001FE5490C|nr:IS4 family transposase [Paraburkholderia humisilvae]